MLAQTDVEKTNTVVVLSLESLDEILKQDPFIQLIYFHPDTLNNLDNSWLQEEYKNGRILAVIHEPISSLTKKLGITTPIGDFGIENSMGRIGVSVVQLLDNEELGVEGYYHYQDFLADFQQIHMILQKTFLTEPRSGQDPGPGILGIGQWSDSYGTLTGNTWFTQESSEGFVWYYGHAYSSYNHTPYWIRVRADTYNTCGGYHQVSSKDVSTNNYPFITTGKVLAGSSQCPGQSSMTIFVNDTHQVQRFSWNPAKLTGNTSEQQNVPTPQ